MMTARTVATFLTFLLLGSPSHVSPHGVGSGKGPMSRGVYEILRSAVVDATGDRPKVRDDNLEALERLRKAPWPHVGQLPWFHVYVKDAQGGQYTGAWKIEENDTDITLLTAGLVTQAIKKSQVKEMQPASFRDDLRVLVRYCTEREEDDKRKWDFTYIQGFGRRGFPFYGGVFLLRYAYAAADHGMKEETTALVAEVFKQVPKGLPNLYNELVWQELRPAMFAFQAGGSRRGFLETCKHLRENYPGSRYDDQLDSIIEPLAREMSKPKPFFLKKGAGERTPEERIRYWVYELRDLAGRQATDPGYPGLFCMNAVRPMPTDQLVAIGPPAIPYLIAALEDDTPTRTIAWQRSFYPVHYVLRRQDVAIKCLERIVGCQFYDEASTSMHFYRDSPERQRSLIVNVTTWWRESQGVSQAEMIRNQLRLMDNNITLRPHARVHALEMLAMLEGPEAVVAEGDKLLAEDGHGLNSATMRFLDRVNPRAPVQAVFRRFWSNQTRDGDYTYLFKYGDKSVYEEIVRRFQQTGKLDPGPWTIKDQVRMAAKHGKNWAIPIAAGVLDRTEISGSRYVSKEVGSQPYSHADVAVEVFQELTGRDFGYTRDGTKQERLAAIERARHWWERQGRRSLGAKTDEDHPPGVDAGDLFMSDQDLEAVVAEIQGDDAVKRRDAVSRLGRVRTYQLQRALLSALEKEKRSDDRARLLSLLEQRPSPWHLPTLTEIFQSDGDVGVRVHAGRLVAKCVSNKSTSIWWQRLEVRDAALEQARRLVRDRAEPQAIREAAISVLLAWNSIVDQGLLHELAPDTQLGDYEPLRLHIDRMNKRLEEIPARTAPRD